MCAFAFRDLLRIDPRLFDADGLFEWSTWPRGLWFPLVVAGAAGLAWRRRASWLALPQGPGRWLAGAALCASAVAIVWGRLTGVGDLLVWSFALAAVSIATWRRGAAGVCAMALPILFLVLALAPPPRLLNEALWWIQSLSARAATALVQATGAPVLGESIRSSTRIRFRTRIDRHELDITDAPSGEIERIIGLPSTPSIRADSAIS